MNKEDNSSALNENQSANSDLPQHAISEIVKIKEELERLNSHKLITAYDSIVKLLFFQFMKGAAFGLGTLFGASIIISALIFLLSQIEFIPIIGDWIKEILVELKTTGAAAGVVDDPAAVAGGDPHTNTGSDSGPQPQPE